jgi:hypothetical protein
MTDPTEKQAPDELPMCDHDAVRKGPHQGLPMHPCPYREELHDDFEPHCTCCDACRQECVYDI